MCCVCLCLTACHSHSHEYKETVVVPTCTEKGYTLYECECGDSYKGTYINATGHKAEWITEREATCTKDGLEYKKCTICGETIDTEKISARHKYGDDNKCTVCGAINPKYPYIELPMAPITLYDSTYTQCIVKSITTADYYSTSSGNYSYTEITFLVEKTYDAEGNSYSRGCNFGYKIYDEDNLVIDSGAIYTEAIKVGESTKKVLTVWKTDLSGGKSYRLVLLYVN